VLGQWGGGGGGGGCVPKQRMGAQRIVMNTATIRFFTLPLKIFLDRDFFGSCFAPPTDFLLA